MVRLQTDYLDQSPDLVVVDSINDGVAFHRESFEALIRRMWAAFPLCKIVFMKFFAVADRYIDANVNSPTTGAWQQTYEDLCSYYGITIVDYHQAIVDLVAAGRHLYEFLIDTVHPSTDGHNVASSLLETILTQSFLTTRQSPDPLPARLYDNGDYENTAVIKNGTGYDSKTGTWSEVGTTISSSEADATVTFSGTFQSIGRPEADGAVQLSIDGGAYGAITFGPNGYEIPAGRAAHTATIKVISGTVTISKFWAI